MGEIKPERRMRGIAFRRERVSLEIGCPGKLSENMTFEDRCEREVGDRFMDI